MTTTLSSFIRVHIEAGHENHVLLAIFDVNEALFIHATDIARTQPAVGQHYLRGLVGSIPVATLNLRRPKASSPTVIVTMVEVVEARSSR